MILKWVNGTFILIDWIRKKCDFHVLIKFDWGVIVSVKKIFPTLIKKEFELIYNWWCYRTLNKRLMQEMGQFHICASKEVAGTF